MTAPTLLELFCIFFCIGLFTIGGGLVAITSMQQIVVGRGWITSEKFFNMVAISESTPGPIGVNMATYIGYEFHGTFGGIVAWRDSSVIHLHNSNREIFRALPRKACRKGGL